MTEVERIVDQSQRAFAGDAWHGPSLMAIIEGLTAAQASARPFPSAHSIWELVFHIAAWEQAGVRRLGGDPADLSDDEDWPTVTETTEQAWEQTKATLKTGHQELQDAISRLDDSTLNQLTADGRVTIYGTLHGIIQHTLYHAGQIAILKKGIGKASDNE